MVILTNNCNKLTFNILPIILHYDIMHKLVFHNPLWYSETWYFITYLFTYLNTFKIEVAHSCLDNRPLYIAICLSWKRYAVVELDYNLQETFAVLQLYIHSHNNYFMETLQLLNSLWKLQNVFISNNLLAI